MHVCPSHACQQTSLATRATWLASLLLVATEGTLGVTNEEPLGTVLSTLKLTKFEQRLEQGGVNTTSDLLQLQSDDMRFAGIGLGARVRLLKWIKTKPSVDAREPVPTTPSPFMRPPSSGIMGIGDDSMTGDGTNGALRATEPLPTVAWESGINLTVAMSQPGAKPFMLTGSPTTRWAAVADKTRRWTPKRMKNLIFDGMRSSDKEEFLYFKSGDDEKHWFENTLFWDQHERDPNTVINLGRSNRATCTHLAPKMLKVKKPHEMGSGKDIVRKIMKANRGGESRFFYGTGQFSDLGNSAEEKKLLMSDLQPLGSVVGEDNTDSVKLWVGSPNCTATFHYDTDHNVFVQIYGKKRWIIMSPAVMSSEHARIFFSTHPSERQLLQSQDVHVLLREAVANGNAYEVTMGPGDVLVLPAFWLHSVRVVEGPAFSVNSWTADYTISPVYADTMQFAWVRGKAKLTTEAKLMAKKITGPKIRNLREVQHIAVSLIVGLWLGHPASALPECRDGLLGPYGARRCARAIIGHKLSQRWASLVDLEHRSSVTNMDCPLLKYGAVERATMKMADGSEQQYVLAFPASRHIGKIRVVVEALRHYAHTHPHIAPTVLWDKLEQMALMAAQIFDQGAGVRDMPFFLKQCF